MPERSAVDDVVDPATDEPETVTVEASVEGQRIRAAEVIGAACLATDLGMGFPFEHGLHATLMTMRLADLLDLDRETASQTYYVSLLMYSGCTTDTEIGLRIFANSRTRNLTPAQFGSPAEAFAGVIRSLPPPDAPPHVRAYEIARRLPMAAAFRKGHFAAICEVAAMMSERLGLPRAIRSTFERLTERWDGKGVLRRAKRDEIPLPLRVVHVARDAAYQRVVGGDEHATETIRRRAGGAFDPEIAEVFAREAGEVFEAADASDSTWEAALAAEPRPWLTLEGDAIDRALAAIGDFGDLASPSLSGHSAGVAELAADAARLCGLDEAEVSLVRRAAHVHDVGRVAVHPKTWNKAGPLGADEWEQVRLHAYHSERVFSRSPLLASIGAVGCAHHERLDGSGYHRAVTAVSLPPAARLVAAADAFHAMTEPRPHRPPLSPEEAARTLSDEARDGRLDPVMVSAVLEAADQPAPQIERPAGLTEREAEVVGLLAQGRQTKQVARTLGISIKTADHHIQNAYRKMGVSTRAGATLFAMEHGLVPWGALPIPQTGERP